MRQLLDAVDFGLLLVDRAGVVRLANRWIRDRSRGAGPVVGEPVGQALGEAPSAPLLAAVRRCLDIGNAARLSQAFHPTPLPLYRSVEPGAERLRQAVDVIPVAWFENDERHALVQVRDVSDLVRREQALHQQARQLARELERVTDTQRCVERQSMRYREMTRLAPVALFETNVEGRLVYLNPRAIELLGQPEERLYGRHWSELFGAEGAEARDRLSRWLASSRAGSRYADEFVMGREGGRQHWLRLEASVLSHGEGRTEGHLCMLLDVTELREAARRNEFRANHDALTGLRNRECFDAALGALLPAGPVGVLFLDLDLFKTINDTYGHAAGDGVLKAVASRLRGAVRSSDLVSRFGGDEFAVLLADVQDRAALECLAAKASQAIEAPIDLGGVEVSVRAAVGIAMAPEDGHEREALLAFADAAMYASKRANRRRAEAAGGSADVPAPSRASLPRPAAARPHG